LKRREEGREREEAKLRLIMEKSVGGKADDIAIVRAKDIGVPRDYSENEKEQVLNALKDMCVLSKNAFAGKTWLQAKGEFKEVTEVQIGLSADEIARRNLEAERRLKEGGYSVEDVP